MLVITPYLMLNLNDLPELWKIACPSGQNTIKKDIHSSKFTVFYLNNLLFTTKVNEFFQFEVQKVVHKFPPPPLQKSLEGQVTSY